MVNFETIRLLEHINELAALTENGIKPFSEATAENTGDFVFYDANDEARKPHDRYPVVLDMCVDESHHDIISYDEGDNFETVVIIDENGEPFIAVIEKKDNENADCCFIVIEDGTWYFA